MDEAGLGGLFGGGGALPMVGGKPDRGDGECPNRGAGVALVWWNLLVGSVRARGSRGFAAVFKMCVLERQGRLFVRVEGAAGPDLLAPSQAYNSGGPRRRPRLIRPQIIGPAFAGYDYVVAPFRTPAPACSKRHYPELFADDHMGPTLAEAQDLRGE